MNMTPMPIEQIRLVESGWKMPKHETFGSRLARLRGARKLTQDALGRRVGVTSTTVSRWERDDMAPNGAALGQLAEALEVSMDELMLGSTAMASLDRREADGFPLSSDELMSQAAKLVGLSPEQTSSFFAERRRGGMPYALSMLITIAEGYREAGKAALPFNAAVDRAPVERLVDPEGDAAPRLKGKSPKSRR